MKKLNEKPGKAEITAIEEHVTLLTKKLIIIILLMFVALIGLGSLVIGVIGYERKCLFNRQPSLPIWLIVLGCISILLVAALIFLVRYMNDFIVCLTRKMFLDYIRNNDQI